MKMIKCDRCGKIFKEGRIHNRIILEKEGFFPPVPSARYDLCPDCMKRIKYFLNNDGAEEI